MRELVGDDGEAIAVYMLSVMRDEQIRTADRLEAAKWLADRGFGRSVQTLDMDITAHPAIDVTTISTEDLDAMLAILEKYEPDAAELAAAGELEIGSSVKTGASRAAGCVAASCATDAPQAAC